MSWTLKKKAQALLAAEQGTIRKDWGGQVAVALVYPNTYAVGHVEPRLPDDLPAPERAARTWSASACSCPIPPTWPSCARTQTPPFSLESQRPLTDFHLVGFSVTYEGDYINVLRLLDLAGIPLRAAARRPHDPLVLMGGVCAFSNPEPLAPFMDFIVVGEGEELVGELIAAYRAALPRPRELPRPARRRSTACTCPSATTSPTPTTARWPT